MEEHAQFGDYLDHYLVQEVIGVGSFATVYRARDERLESTVVLKVLAENHSLNPEVRERFIAEGRCLRRVGPPHAVTVHDIGESDRQQPYLVLEHADRGTLRQRVEELWHQGWRASRDDVLALARALAAAVGAVHRANLVHRDLSPGNLLLASRTTVRNGTGGGDPDSQLVREDDRLLIADLGMCKDLARHSGLTVAAGTSGFRPPEQHGPAVIDIRADIWALSALVAWAAQDAQLPRALHRVLKRGMATRPERRQPDVARWLTEVEQALAPPEPAPHGADQTLPAGPGQPAATANGTTQPPARPHRVRGPVLAGVVTCVALAGLLGGYLLGVPEDPPAQSQQASVAVEGPTEVTVGEPAVFDAVVEGARSWTWLLPTGRYVSDEDQVSLIPTVAGSAEVILRARAPDGTELETRHTVQVHE